MTNLLQHTSGRVGDTVFYAPRQMWLASLGAAAVTREWAEKEAGNVLRTLIREGMAMESRAIRFVGDRVESSVVRANDVWRKTRATVESTVRTYADSAVSLVRHTLPRSLPIVDIASSRKSAQPTKVRATRSRKTVKGRAGGTAKRAKGSAKSAGKR